VPMAAPPVLGALAVLLQSTTLPSVKLAAPAALLQLGAQKHQATLPAPSSGRCDWNFRCAFALQVPPGPAPGVSGRARSRQAAPAERRPRACGTTGTGHGEAAQQRRCRWGDPPYAPPCSAAARRVA